jgi:hypothetical protein
MKDRRCSCQRVCVKQDYALSKSVGTRGSHQIKEMKGKGDQMETAPLPYRGTGPNVCHTAFGQKLRIDSGADSRGEFLP